MKRPLLLLGALAALALAGGLLWWRLPIPTARADAPVAFDVTAATTANVSVTFQLVGEHPCTVDVDFEIVTDPDEAHGDISSTSSGDLESSVIVSELDDFCNIIDSRHRVNVTFAPASGFTGTATVTYRAWHDANENQAIDGGEVASATHTVPINVTASAAPPPSATAADKVELSASGDLTLGASMQDVPGLAVTLDAGNWKVEVCLLFSEQGSGDEGQSAAFRLVTGGIVELGAGVTRLYDGQLQTTCFNWLIDLPLNTVVTVQARKSGGGGDSKVLSGNETSRLIATEEP